MDQKSIANVPEEMLCSKTELGDKVSLKDQVLHWLHDTGSKLAQAFPGEIEVE
jgi:hypothetical protein